ncbi:hypothetical protein ADK70_01915 [Streptomyces rimosus subsp. pseudoverticillatus]|uniref:hypothetical protein n=1 Tax=Streptomyces rimosus TaxID=1927 RepID=UPI0006B29060|nr:hypothetical protein [Streptomyces rimosus]KOT99933.1 hypothetical protein ADK70_01915 [Streptomyces rimosus subsp. pseudoverticillatus]
MRPRPHTPSLPSWLTWWQRPFPDANTLLLHGLGSGAVVLRDGRLHAAADHAAVPADALRVPFPRAWTSEPR